MHREEEARRKDLTRTLTVKKRLRDHLLLKGFYDQKPNYAELARTLTKRNRSVLKTREQSLIQKFESEQYIKSVFGKRRISKPTSFAKKDTIQAYNLHTLTEEISDLRMMREMGRGQRMHRSHLNTLAGGTDAT